MVNVVFNVSILFLPLAIYLLNLSYNTNYKLKHDKLFLSLFLIIQVILFIVFKEYSNSLNFN